MARLPALEFAKIERSVLTLTAPILELIRRQEAALLLQLADDPRIRPVKAALPNEACC